MKITFSLSTFIIFLLVLASQAVGQTAITTIENEAGEPVLKSFDYGGFLLLGEFNDNAESVPIEGEGVRLMWYPGKAAFRVGLVTGSQWDEENIGTRSTAMGANTTASGNGSTAMGGTTTASGDFSTTMGAGTTASGSQSTAIGFGTEASGRSSTAIGFWTVAAAQNSLSAGQYNSANTVLDGTIFVIGNGSVSNRSDALRLSTGGNLTIAGTLTQNSDRRLKTDIEPIGGGTLAKLGAIEPVRYQFKNQQTHPEGTQIGLIAQQVQEHFPELVSENSSGYLSLSYSNLSTVLLKGMQEQQEQIEYQRGEIEFLKESLATLEQQNRQHAGLPFGTMLLIGFLAVAGAIGFRFVPSSLQKQGAVFSGKNNSAN